MRINQGFAASGRGYVRAVFSRRMRGYALPLDLVRVHLRASNSCRLLPRRLRAAFAGYLVSESDIAPFSESRKNYQPRRVGLMNTGFPFPSNFGGDIDAPEWIASGAMTWVDSVGWFPIARKRGES